MRCKPFTSLAAAVTGSVAGSQQTAPPQLAGSNLAVLEAKNRFLNSKLLIKGQLNCSGHHWLVASTSDFECFSGCSGT